MNINETECLLWRHSNNVEKWRFSKKKIRRKPIHQSKYSRMEITDVSPLNSVCNNGRKWEMWS